MESKTIRLRAVLIPSSSGLKAGRFDVERYSLHDVLIPSSSGLKAGPHPSKKANFDKVLYKLLRTIDGHSLLVFQPTSPCLAHIFC